MNEMIDSFDIKQTQHTCHVSDGHRGSLRFLYLRVNADLVLATRSEVVKAVSGSSTSQPHFLSLTICKATRNKRADLE